MKEQIKTPEQQLNEEVKSQPIRCRVQNTGNQDAHRIDQVQLQNKGRRKGYTK